MYKSIKQTKTMKAARSVMGMLQATKFPSMLAGGYLRDEATGKPQKDVDIFVSLRSNQHWIDVFRMLLQLSFIMKFTVVDKAEAVGTYTSYVDAGSTLVRVLGIKFDDETILEMDIIIVNIPIHQYIRESFPTNASQVYSYDGVEMYWSSVFQRFLSEKVMVYTGKNYRKGYRERMKKKYPEYTEEFAEGFNPDEVTNAKGSSDGANQSSTGSVHSINNHHQSLH